MASVLALGSNPIWYFVDINGKPLSGGFLYAFSSLNPSVKKLIYKDPAFIEPYSDPIQINGNGTAGPLYFEVDDDETPYLLIATDIFGNEVWTVNGYLPGTQAGGGGGGTVIINLDDIITNNIFMAHADPASSVQNYQIIAPSNQPRLSSEGLTNDGMPSYNDPNIPFPSPDIVFIKNNTSATDSINFPLFNLDEDPIVGDTAPIDAFNYTCTAPGANELSKFLQIPLTAKVNNLSNEIVSGTFWAKATGLGPQELKVTFLQYFGDGPGASSPVIVSVLDNDESFDIANGWNKYSFTTQIPSVSGKQLGAPSNSGPNDGLFLRFNFPLNSTCNISLTKPSLFLGNFTLSNEFKSYDKVASVVFSPRTGDLKHSVNAYQPGWVPCNDGVLGNGSAMIVPPGRSITRNNPDTYPLYAHIWQTCKNNQFFAPMFDATGVPVAYGATPIADFNANRWISVGYFLGRALIGLSSAMPLFSVFTFDIPNSTLKFDATNISSGQPIVLTSTGTYPNGVGSGVTYYVIKIDNATIQLSYELDNLVPITLSGTDSGTHSIQNPLFVTAGNSTHTLTPGELPSITLSGNLPASKHTPFADGKIFITSDLQDNGTVPFSINNGGGNLPHNNIPPITYTYLMMKL